MLGVAILIKYRADEDRDCFSSRGSFMANRRREFRPIPLSAHDFESSKGLESSQLRYSVFPVLHLLTKKFLALHTFLDLLALLKSIFRGTTREYERQVLVETTDVDIVGLFTG